MNEPQECLDITARFFKALDLIREQKRIRGLKTFTDRYGENYWNCHTLKKSGARIKQEWLTYLVRDYNVSPTWLLTGKGKIFTKHIQPRQTFIRTSTKHKTPTPTDTHDTN